VPIPYNSFIFLTRQVFLVKEIDRSEIKESPVVFGSHGIKLNGKIVMPASATADHPVPAAVLCHGFGSAYRVMEPAARIMATQGVGSLIFDFRGHGGSEGAIDGMMPEDVIDAWGILCQLPEVDSQRMGVVGHSLGALSAIMAAQNLQSPKALIALACPPQADSPIPSNESGNFGRWGRQSRTIVEYPKNGAFPWMKGLAALICRIWMYLGCFKVRVDWGKFIGLYPKMNMSEVLRKLEDCSKLFVFCEGDRVTPYRKYTPIFQAACQPKELILAKGGFHTTPLLRGSLRSQWTSWMVKTLTA
jgi:pimeloyl-ACP methyl ester carboxylesterase